MPSSAAAAAPLTFHVTTTADSQNSETDCGGSEACSLRDAIRLADQTAARDKVEFTESAEGVIHLGSELPRITHPIIIEGTTAPNYAGTPLVTLDGSTIDSDGATTEGLVVEPAAGSSRIRGLAIGGFTDGVWLDGTVGSQICASYVGVEADGTTPLPNRIGAEVGGSESSSAENEIGVGCGSAGGNLISGNREYGIVDIATTTKIGDNRIGVDVNGAPLPNGGEASQGDGEGPSGAGIYESSAASGATIGGPGKENIVADNQEFGVYVFDADSKVKIRANSIFGNRSTGIAIGQNAPVKPTIEALAEPFPGRVIIEGTAHAGAPGEQLALDFYASESCDGGEGQAFLGSKVVESPGAEVHYEAEVGDTLGGAKPYITATSTGEAVGQTSEFSGCVAAEPERTIVVNTLEDTTDGGECLVKCSLRDAITLADETEAPDLIEFAASAEGTIQLGAELPSITHPVAIDGPSAPGYAGEPVVAIKGPGGADKGLQVGGDGNVSISGLAIGNFHSAVYLGGAGLSQVCSSWLGVGLGGAPLANGAGVFVASGSEENEIGVGCGAAPPNVIAGNSAWGIEDFGKATQVGDDVVGISPSGSADGNGAGGVRVAEGASEGVVGGGGEVGAPGGNQIAFNHGPGVLVEEGTSKTWVRGNSIYSNDGKGIEVAAAPPAPPTITVIEVGSGLLRVKGAAPEGANEEVELDFYASATCSPLDRGVGEEFLGTEDADGGTYEAVIEAPASDDRVFLTVTSTGTVAEQTSEFSACRQFTPEPEPEPKPEPEPETKIEVRQQPGPTQTVVNKIILEQEASPINGEQVVVAPAGGEVLIKLPGSKKYVKLKELKEIPLGATIDVTKGKIKLTSIGPGGKEQTATFYGGVFKVTQKEGSNFVVLELVDSTVCKAPEGGRERTFLSTLAARPGSGTSGKLWGSGHGSFKTEGNNGSATVRGTIWLVEDRCDGTTFFRTKRGVVTVKDFVTHKTLSLPAGKSYVAGEK